MHVPEDDADEPAQINIVPMIDVVFALLTFFMMASLYLARSQSLDVNLPEASTAGTQTESQISVTISPQGDVSLNQTPIAVEQLPNAIRALKGNQSTAFVVISGDVEVNYGRVIEVMDQLRSVEGIKIGVATQ
ncbi:MAG: biopolymer transporter ExbD [Cyanobacteria bacterium CRU_2_1]|nr:biopolymer transporter ExbD [Cyanobacteria bacterium CRU_2_1]